MVHIRAKTLIRGTKMLRGNRFFLFEGSSNNPGGFPSTRKKQDTRSVYDQSEQAPMGKSK
jgi:hypothetical protein